MASRATSTDSVAQARFIEAAFKKLSCDIPEKLSVDTTMKCASKLVSNGDISDAEKETIVGQMSPTRCASELCNNLAKKGEKSIRAFVGILLSMKSTEGIAQDIIKEALRLGLKKWPDEEDLPASMPSLSAEDGPQASKETRRSGNRQARDTALISPRYDLSQERRGQAVIINNINFGKNLKVRHGSDLDAAALEKALTTFRFDVTTHKNRTAQQIKTILKTVSEEDHSKAGAFVCAVLSHGGSGFVYGADEKPVMYDEIFELFKRDKCRSLVRKPKLFFIQACRGLERDRFGTDSFTDGDKHWMEHWPREADFLIGFATTPCSVSYRLYSEGSFFIQGLCKVFRDSPELELQHMLISVNREVAERFIREEKDLGVYLKQMPSIVNQLTRELYFE